jgi:hypothetical protein
LSYKYVGKELPRVDAFEKVTGMTKFVADMEAPGMLYTRILAPVEQMPERLLAVANVYVLVEA